MTSLADEILFLADTWAKRLFEVRVEKADFKLDCYMPMFMNFEDNVNPKGLCVIEDQQKLLLADSGTDGGLLVVNLEDGTTLQLLQNGSPKCCQIHGVCLSGQSVIFTDTKSHVETVHSRSSSLGWNKQNPESRHNNWKWYKWNRGRPYRRRKSIVPNGDYRRARNNFFR